MRDRDDLFAALQEQPVPQSLPARSEGAGVPGGKDLADDFGYARQFIVQRLAPASPSNDGKQTPMRGHPAFIAQHATATCCRACLAKWHFIPPGRELTEEQVAYVVGVMRTLARIMGVALSECRGRVKLRVSPFRVGIF